MPQSNLPVRAVVESAIKEEMSVQSPVLPLQEEIELTAPSQGKIARNTLTYLLSQLITWSATFINLSFLPRLMGETVLGKGYLSESLQGMIFGLFSFAIEPYLIRDISARPKQIPCLLYNALGLRLAILPIVLTLYLSALYRVDHSPTMRAWMMLHGGVLIFIAFSGPMLAVLSGTEQARRVGTYSVLAPILNVIILPVYKFYGIQGYAIAYIGCAAFSFSLLFYWVNQSYPIRFRFHFPTWIELTRGGLPFLVNGLALGFYDMTTKFGIRYLLNDAAVAVYGQAYRLIGTLLFFPTALGMALLPALSKLANRDDEEIKRIQIKVFRLLFALGIPLTVGLFFLAPALCHLLYGNKQYLDAPATLQVYAFALVPLYIVSTMYQFLVVKRKNGFWIGVILASIVVNILLNFALIPLSSRLFHHGVMGAAFSTVIIETLCAVCAVKMMGNEIFTPHSSRKIAFCFVAGFGMSSVMFFLQSSPALISALLGGLTYVLLGWRLHLLDPDEEAKLGSLFAKFTRRKREQAVS